MFNTLSKIIKYPRLTQKYPKKPMDASRFIGLPEIDGNRCTLCGECCSRCPSRAIVMDKTAGKIGVNADECVFCVLCEDICPASAIQMSHQFELAQKDRNDLRVSDAGIDSGTITDESLESLQCRVEDKIKKTFGRSLQIREVDAGSCNGCDLEINALNNPFNDIERLGIHFVASPRHADMLLVTGCATRNMEQALIKTYHATPDPKLVVAVGACACSGGIFSDSYSTRNGIDGILPVDAYIPGCPPRPQAILYGILKALDKIK
jgi:Ni,Fe-hydrogenase III small subunit/formate hydrogenlyase subunit 6/NADH:ubiquinone oxidoreductase subunit I